MPERPALPAVTVSRREAASVVDSLPVKRVTTTVTTPDGRRFTILGGYASPLSWLPMPVMGCALNSGAPSWECGAQFWRNGFTPIVPGNTRFGRDSLVLASALGLTRVAPADRSGGDQTIVRAKMNAVEADTLSRQLAAIDRMVADPLGDAEWQVGVVANTADALQSRAEPIMRGVERAASYRTRNERSKARESGRVLAGLLAALPDDHFVVLGPRILALYTENAAPLTDRDDSSSRRGESHWLWESEALLRRVGDLGPSPLPVATDRRASLPNVNGAGVEAMCRIGQAGRAAAPTLLAMWAKTDRIDIEERRQLFVAMRRIGIQPPPISERPDDLVRRERGVSTSGGTGSGRRNPLDHLMNVFRDVTPQSSPTVCSASEIRQRR